MALIRVKVGAQLDPSAVNIFKPLIAAANAARAQIGAAGKQGAEDFVGGYRTAPAKARAGFDDVAAAAEKGAERATAAARRSAREQQALYTATWNYKKRLIEDESRAAEKALAKRQSMVTQIGGGALSTVGGMLGRGAGFVGQVARGAGVDLDVGSLTGKVGRAQKTAVDISNSAYMEGEKGPAGQRQDPRKLVAEVRDVADATGLDTNEALAGLQKFVAKTSDLQTGRDILGDMARLAKVTSASLDDMVDAAGDVSKNLGDIPDNAAKTSAIMTIIAQQGKLGSVEIKDLASQMAKVASGASKFSGGSEKAIVALGAMAQTARGTGGAASANQAATSVASFVSDLTSKAGQKALSGKVDIWADKGKTQMKPINEIVGDILTKSGGDLSKISAMVPGKQSSRALGGFAKIYNDAERAEKGTGAAKVQAEFDRLTKTLSKEEIAKSFATTMETTESKVQLFNNQLERIAEKASGKLLPALEALGPAVLRAAEGVAALATFVAENPLKAAFAGVGLAIGKEIAAAGIKAAINNALAGSVGGLAIGSAVIAITAATIAMRERSETNTTEAIAHGYKAADALNKGLDAGSVSADTQRDAERALQIAQSKVENAGAPVGGAVMDAADKYGGPLVDLLRPILAYNTVIGSGVANAASGGKYGTSFQDQSQQGVDAGRIGELKAEMAAVKAALDRLASGTQKVIVTNQPGAPVGGPAPGTTTGPAAVRH